MSSGTELAKVCEVPPEIRRVEELLSEPFEPSEVKWKPQVVRGNRAMSIAYVDARVIEDRLDDVFGVDGWQDGYQILPNNNVACKLRVRVGGEWVEKCDVGGPSDQPDDGDRMKAAFSDALKRAAVKLGIGRYLYRLPHQWLDYDPQSRQLTQAPKLPAWALPKPKQTGLSAAQAQEVKDALATNRASQRKLLDRFEVSNWRELPAKRFNEALALAKNPPKDWIIEHRENKDDAAPPKPDTAVTVEVVNVTTNKGQLPAPSVDATATRPNGVPGAELKVPPAQTRAEREASLPKDRNGAAMAESAKPKVVGADTVRQIVSVCERFGIDQKALREQYQLGRWEDLQEAQLPVLRQTLTSLPADSPLYFRNQEVTEEADEEIPLE